jgi:hypothetical protein
MRRSLARSVVVVATLAGMGVLSDSLVALQLSSIDLQQTDAATTFGPRLGVLRLMQTQTVDDRKKYELACRGKVTSIRPVPTPGIPLDRTLIGQGAIVTLGELPRQGSFPQKLELKNETSPVCRMLAADIEMRSAHLKDGLARIDEDARRRGIYPGVMRDLKRHYGFE